MTLPPAAANLFADLANATAPDDTSISSRALLSVAVSVTSKGQFAGDRAALLDQARALTRQHRHAPLLERGDDEGQEHEDQTLQKKRRPAEELNLRATREIVEALEPAATRIRELCFQQTQPPFGSLQEAAAWIEGQSVERWAGHGRAEERAYAQTIGAAIDEANRADAWLTYWFSYNPNNVEYWDGGGNLRVRQVRKDTEPLASLLSFTTVTAERTTLPPAAILAFVLTGLQPGQRVTLNDGRRVTLPALQVLAKRRLLTTNTRPSVEQIVITLDARDLTDRNLRRVREQATRMAQPRQRLTARQQRCVDVVAQFGGPPAARYDRTFWGRIARKLRVDDPIAAARLYYRAKKRE